MSLYHNNDLIVASILNKSTSDGNHVVVVGRVIESTLQIIVSLSQDEGLNLPSCISLAQVEVLNVILYADGSLGAFGQALVDFLESDKCVRVQHGTEQQVRKLHGHTFHNIFCQVQSTLHITMIFFRFIESRKRLTDNEPMVAVVWNKALQQWFVMPANIRDGVDSAHNTLKEAIKQAQNILDKHPRHQPKVHIQWEDQSVFTTLVPKREDTMLLIANPNSILQGAIFAYLAAESV